MNVAAILDSKGRAVETISPDARLTEAILRIWERRIGALVVSRDGLHIEGLLTERTMIAALAAHGPDVLERRVADAMDDDVHVCSPDESLRHVMHVMTLHRTRHLPVMDDGRLCGIVSIGDVVKHRLGELEMEARVLRDAVLARSP